MKTVALISKNSGASIKSVCDDISRLMDCVKESRFDSKSRLHELRDLMDMNECNSVLYFETTKRKRSLWITHVDGPSVKLTVLGLKHMRFLEGNALKECGPMLLFTGEFESGHLLHFKTLMEKICLHEKVSDRSICFYYHGGLIWMRCYNIKTAEEIGPRLTLRIEKVLEKCLYGETVYSGAKHGPAKPHCEQPDP